MLYYKQAQAERRRQMDRQRHSHTKRQRHTQTERDRQTTTQKPIQKDTRYAFKDFVVVSSCALLPLSSLLSAK